MKAYSQFKNNADQYDLIITDVRMPQMSGIELIKNINKVNKEVKVLLMSAFEMERGNLKELELEEFLQKPLHLEQLLKTVKKYVHEKWIDTGKKSENIATSDLWRFMYEW